MKQHLDVALKKNITLQNVIGKIPSGIIDHELELNKIIETEILPLYTAQVNLSKHMFNLHLVEPPENHSYLDLKNKPSKLIKAAFKFIRNFDIRMVDFTNVGFHDDGILMLAAYLRTNPNLRSIKLDNNQFTDDGLKKLTEELKYNTKLAHISIKGCVSISDAGLSELNEVITSINTVLFQIDLDHSQFDQ